MAQPMWRSISTIFSTLSVSRRVEVTRFSTPRTTPSEVATPMAVEPSLMASREYSTWKRRPSGEKVLVWFGKHGDVGFHGFVCLFAKTYLIPRSGFGRSAWVCSVKL
jgi:hypothetical protein